MIVNETFSVQGPSGRAADIKRLTGDCWSYRLSICGMTTKKCVVRLAVDSSVGREEQRQTTLLFKHRSAISAGQLSR